VGFGIRSPLQIDNASLENLSSLISHHSSRCEPRDRNWSRDRNSMLSTLGGSFSCVGSRDRNWSCSATTSSMWPAMVEYRVQPFPQLLWRTAVSYTPTS
jgi:hypothetical protein